MKRLHLHIKVQDLKASQLFYSAMLGNEPTVIEEDYIKWKLDDPVVNFAISLASESEKIGLDHLGLQTDNNEELEQIHASLSQADITDKEEKNTNCCYANSDKYWSLDPSGIPWEAFHSLSEIKTYGEKKASFSTVCCAQ